MCGQEDLLLPPRARRDAVLHICKHVATIGARPQVDLVKVFVGETRGVECGGAPLAAIQLPLRRTSTRADVAVVMVVVVVEFAFILC